MFFGSQVFWNVVAGKFFAVNRAILRVCQITVSVPGLKESRKIELMGKQSGFVNFT